MSKYELSFYEERQIPDTQRDMFITRNGRIRVGENYIEDEGTVKLTLKDGKIKTFLRSTLVYELFKNEKATKEEIEDFKRREKKFDTVSVTLEQFNRLIYPNQLIALYWKKPRKKYERVNNWEKPKKVDLDNKYILLKKNRVYFGIGTTATVKFDGLFPENGVPTDNDTSYRIRQSAESQGLSGDRVKNKVIYRAFDKDGNLVGEFKKLRDAAKSTKHSMSSINRYLSGTYKHFKDGMTFDMVFLEEEK